ncbi:MAG: hypothetical protein IJ189_00135 [Clostridia bacterium]|nr:hypothetical protein [Clostridia bacterium]
MKNENRVSFTVRLNLNNPRHKEAWNRLRNSTGSYTTSIVDALTKEANPSAVFPDANGLKAIMRQAFLEAMRELPITMQPFIASEEIGGDREIDDLDFEIADDFMSALGC